MRQSNIFQVDLEHFYCDYHIDVKAMDNVEEWQKYRERTLYSTERLLHLLKERGVIATFFVLGCVANRYPDLIERIEREGHEIASHGYWHQLATRQSPEEFHEDLKQSLEVLGRLSRQKIIGYRTCNCSLEDSTSWIIDILESHGLKYDSSIFPFKARFYGVSGAPTFPYYISSRNIKVESSEERLVEIPLSMYRIPILQRNVPFSGGFYFRFWPYRFVRHCLRKLNKNDEPGVCYIHNWELDPNQPRISQLHGKLYHYWGLGNTEEKLNKLFDDFSFTSTREWLELNNV
jgi:polysaccharide deacetylase family protein (PEP-CTERM system associated)